MDCRVNVTEKGSSDSESEQKERTYTEKELTRIKCRKQLKSRQEEREWSGEKLKEWRNKH